MLQDLAEVGVPVTSLLVIPDHHRKGRIDADPEFSSWLKEVVAQGHEAVLHGYYHLRPEKKGENLATRLITRSYTAGEGEFYDLSFEQASALLQQGREALQRCGGTPDGSIPGLSYETWLYCPSLAAGSRGGEGRSGGGLRLHHTNRHRD